jgi:hypothetical protein
LQGHEYKLWHIAGEDKDSLEWIHLDTVKLNSFWVRYKDVDECINDPDRNSEHACYCRFSTKKEMRRFQFFKKKRNAPEFLYLDRNGYACVLVLNRETGNFVEKQDAEMTGYWKLKNDSIMIINNNHYLYRKTGNNPNTVVQLTNLRTGDELKITDVRFPPGLSRHEISWTEENDREHHKKWGFGIKQSPFLQGYDCKLWRKEEDFCGTYPMDNGVTDCGVKISYGDIDYITRDYYYCQYMYFDRYGRYAHLYLSGDGWSIHESNCYDDEICCDDLFYIHDWHPNGNDSTLCGYRTVRILQNSNADTLHLRDLDTNEDLRYIAVNLPPKSKNKKFKK